MDKLDALMRFQQTALNLRASRQELLAGNIANADTPNYKARDLKFTDALQQAMSGNSVDLSLQKTSPLHLTSPQNSRSVLGAPVLYRQVVQPSADGNTVDMDVEQVQFADNALRYQASTMFANSKLKGVLSAIQGQ